MSIDLRVKHTRKQIVDILDEVIVEFPRSNVHFTFWSFLNARGITRQQLNHYINVNPYKPIIERRDILRELQENKLINGVLSNNGDMSSVGSMFLLKCKFGYMEEEKAKKLEIEQEKLNKESQLLDTVGQALNVNFNVVEHRSDEEIQSLINESYK